MTNRSVQQHPLFYLPWWAGMKIPMEWPWNTARGLGNLVSCLLFADNLELLATIQRIWIFYQASWSTGVFILVRIKVLTVKLKVITPVSDLSCTITDLASSESNVLNHVTGCNFSTYLIFVDIGYLHQHFWFNLIWFEENKNVKVNVKNLVYACICYFELTELCAVNWTYRHRFSNIHC